MNKITTLALSLLSAGLIGCGAPQDVPVGTRALKLEASQVELSYKEGYCYAKFVGATNRANCVANFSSTAKISDAGVGVSEWAEQFNARLLVNTGKEPPEANIYLDYAIGVLNAADTSQNSPIIGFDPNVISWDETIQCFAINGDSFE